MFTNTVECAPRGQGKQQMMRDDVAQSVLQPARAEGETKFGRKLILVQQFSLPSINMSHSLKS